MVKDGERERGGDSIILYKFCLFIFCSRTSFHFLVFKADVKQFLSTDMFQHFLCVFLDFFVFSYNDFRRFLALGP